MPNILYIMGTGRSGTTILEVMLTNSTGVGSAGEVRHIFRDGFLRNVRCACGAPGRECELWSQVLDATRWEHRDWLEIKGALDRVEMHGRFPLIWAGLAGQRTKRLYRESSATLFTSVAGIQNSAVVVDSSKYAGRALMLARLFPGKVKVLCMTRSAAGVLAAFQKNNEREQWPKKTLPVIVYYFYVLLCMRLVKRRLGEDCLAIRFEELRRDPVGVLQQIETWSGLSLSDARRKLSTGEAFKVGHIVTGNRLRRQGSVRFETSAATSDPRPKHLLVRWVIGWLERYRNWMGF